MLLLKKEFPHFGFREARFLQARGHFIERPVTEPFDNRVGQHPVFEPVVQEFALGECRHVVRILADDAEYALGHFAVDEGLGRLLDGKDCERDGMASAADTPYTLGIGEKLPRIHHALRGQRPEKVPPEGQPPERLRS